MYIIKLLKKMGFHTLTYNEVIITIMKNNVEYSMPIGLKRVKNRLIGRIYRETRLASILSKDIKKATICVSKNPLLFYYVVLEREKLRYTRIREGEACIVDCEACIICNIKDFSRIGKWIKIELEPIHIIIENIYPRVYHRADYGIIEALIYYTKIPYVDQALAMKYYEYLKVFRETVYRSSGDKRLRDIIDNIIVRAEKILETRRKR